MRSFHYCRWMPPDSDKRPRPDGKTLDEFFGEVRKIYPDQLFMADCSSYEEGIHAAEIRFDLIGTTMNGYTDYTKGTKLPNIELMRRLARDCGKAGDRRGQNVAS